jgi:phage protein U
MMMAWGPHTFEAGQMAYDEFVLEAGGRWKDHEIIGRRPAGQYLGPAKEPVKLKGVFFPLDARAASAALRAMQEASRAGETYTLATGRGDVLGVFRLEKARRSESFHIDNGGALRVAYDLEFAAHEDGGGRIWSLWP